MAESDVPSNPNRPDTPQVGVGNRAGVDLPKIKVAKPPALQFWARLMPLGRYGPGEKTVGLVMLCSQILGLIFVGVGAWRQWVCALLWAGACGSVGWVLGFLFGIPRTLSGQQEEPSNKTVVETQEPSLTPDAPAQAKRVIASKATTVNTNLEQVSDWLTKIIVGVGLVELDKVKAALDGAATTIADSLGGGAYWHSYALALMVYFSATGFLGAYLLTRLFLQKVFADDSTPPES